MLEASNNVNNIQCQIHKLIHAANVECLHCIFEREDGQTLLCKLHGVYYEKKGCKGCKKEQQGLVDLNLDIEESKNMIEILTNMGIRKKFLNVNFDNYKRQLKEQEDAYDIALTYAKYFGDIKASNLLILGNTGTGKTHLAVSVMIYLFGKAKRSAFYKPQQLAIEALRAKNRYLLHSHLDLLVIDDLGDLSLTDYEKTALFGIIQDRYDDDAATLITSNLTANEFKLYVGDRIFSRLLRNKNDRIIVNAFEDKRYLYDI